jgi:hypothetical protein
MNGLLFFYLTFWTIFAPLVLFLQILLEKIFKVFLQIVKGTLYHNTKLVSNDRRYK